MVELDQSNQGVLTEPVRPRNLLVLDDDPGVLSILKMQLRKEKTQVFTTSSAIEAMDILEEESIQVVISDLRMPKIDGLEFLSEVKKKYPGVIRMVISSNTDFKKLLEAVNSDHIYGYLCKPWRSEELLIALHKAFKEYDSIREREELLLRSHRLNGELIRLNKSLEKRFNSRVQDLENINKLIDKLRGENSNGSLIQALCEVIIDTVGGRSFALYQKFGQRYRSVCFNEPLFTQLPELSEEDVLSSPGGMAGFFENLVKENGLILPMRRGTDPEGFLILEGKGRAKFPKTLKERIQNLLPLMSLVLQSYDGEIPVAS